jgi:hypothetical protein
VVVAVVHVVVPVAVADEDHSGHGHDRIGFRISALGVYGPQGFT